MVQRQCVTMTQRHGKSKCHKILPSIKMRNQGWRHQVTYLVCPLRGSWPKLQSKIMMTAQTQHQIRHTEKYNPLKLKNYIPKMRTLIIESYITPKPSQLADHNHQHSHLLEQSMETLTTEHHANLIFESSQEFMEDFLEKLMEISFQGRRKCQGWHERLWKVLRESSGEQKWMRNL